MAPHICQSQVNEVTDIRRIFLQLFLVIALVGCLSVPAEAADSNSQAGRIVTASGSLNVRSSPSSAAAVVAKLSKDSLVTLLSRSGSWWKVEYDQNRYGYCHSDYIQILTAEAISVNTQSGSLNVRSGTGTQYAKIGSVARNQTVLRLSQSNGWSKILYNGTKTGYVSSRYLSQSNPPVSRWVRNMKQTDPRWAEKEVADSGKTFAKIGCATTAIAMLESHRTGIVRYPDEMMTMLKYTPSGSVYWPAHYTVVSQSENYLQRIYDLLKQGKPILFGATNSYGSQHWVIITGFAGGSITSDNFTIQDPGSNSRTNLQQFLAAYPNYYKFFYY